MEATFNNSENHTLNSEYSAIQYSTYLTNFLIIGCGFFLACGIGLQKIVPLSLSKLFAAFGLALICYWFLFGTHHIRRFPFFFNAYIVLVVLHIIIGSYILSPEGWDFASDNAFKQRTQDFIQYLDPMGIIIIRFFIFFLIAYAFAMFFENPFQLDLFTFAYSLGLVVTIMNEGYVLDDVSTSDTRLSAGFIDPNYFASNTFCVIFLNLISMVRPNQKFILRMLSIVFIGFALYGLAASSSRSALVAFVIGVIVLVALTPGIFKRMLMAGAIVSMVVLSILYLPEEYKATLMSRADKNRIAQTKGAGRLEIWNEYVKKAPEYFVTGTGFGSHRVRALIDDKPIVIYDTHNEYLNNFVQHGFIGFLFFTLGLYQIFRGLARSTGDPQIDLYNRIYLSFFITWLVFAFFLDTIFIRNWWISLAIFAGYISAKEQGFLNNKQAHE